jgi:hypothetical protein
MGASSESFQRYLCIPTAFYMHCQPFSSRSPMSANVALHLSGRIVSPTWGSGESLSSLAYIISRSDRQSTSTSTNLVPSLHTIRWHYCTPTPGTQALSETASPIYTESCAAAKAITSFKSCDSRIRPSRFRHASVLKKRVERHRKNALANDYADADW